MSVVRVIDSHTCGEPTRLVLEGGPDLGSGPLSDRLAPLPRPLRQLPFRDRQRAARLGRRRRRAAVRRRTAATAASASSSSTTSAISACAATARSASSRRSRTGPGAARAGQDRYAGRPGGRSAARGPAGHDFQRDQLPQAQAGRRRGARRRRSARRHRLGRQLVLPRRAPRAAHRPAERRRAHRFHLARAPGRQRRRAIRKSITSSCSCRRPPAARTAAISCCARARRTIARRAAPAPAPSSRASPPTASWPKARSGCRRA